MQKNIKLIEDYIKSFEDINKFEYIKWDIELKNALYIFSWYILYNYDELQNNKDSKLVKMKIHTISIYLWSIIEAVLFFFINKKIWDKEKVRKKYLELEEFKKYQDIKWTDLYICKIEKKEINLNDSINFKALINWAKDNKIINKKIADKLEQIRKQRNSIHINVFKTQEEIFLDLEKLFKTSKEILDFIELELC